MGRDYSHRTGVRLACGQLRVGTRFPRPVRAEWRGQAGPCWPSPSTHMCGYPRASPTGWPPLPSLDSPYLQHTQRIPGPPSSHLDLERPGRTVCCPLPRWGSSTVPVPHSPDGGSLAPATTDSSFKEPPGWCVKGVPDKLSALGGSVFGPHHTSPLQEAGGCFHCQGLALCGRQGSGCVLLDRTCEPCQP